jgi:hypothetical protein
LFLISRISHNEEKSGNIIRFYDEQWKHLVIQMTPAGEHDMYNDWTHFEIDDDISKNLAWRIAKKPIAQEGPLSQHITTTFTRLSRKSFLTKRITAAFSQPQFQISLRDQFPSI